MSDTITFTLVKSGIDSTKKIQATLIGLGLGLVVAGTMFYRSWTDKNAKNCNS